MHLLLALLTVIGSAAPASASKLEEATQAFRAGEYKRVVELAHGATDAGEDAPKLAYLAGEAQLVLGAPADAETSFRAVIAARPQAVPAQVGLARALARQEKNEEALKVLDTVLEREPKDAPALAARGVVRSNLGKKDEARKDLEQARKLEPEDPWILRDQVEVLLASDDTAGATAAIQSFAKKQPKHPMGPFLLGWTLERAGEDQKAIVQYSLALGLDPNFLDAHKNLAIVCHTLSNTYQDKARVELAYEHYKRYFDLGGQDRELKTMYESLVKYRKQILGE